MQSPIKGLIFNIDTGTSNKLCWKQPIYEPHKIKPIKKTVQKLQEKNIIEGNDGPYGVSHADTEHAEHIQIIITLCRRWIMWSRDGISYWFKD